ncbi:TPA: metal ABC transporter solute-binding protein, Zn/Mn family, partial [Klebsiella pneumoniae]
MAVSLPVRALEVLTTIKPLGFIAAAITDGVSEPGVLLPTGASPHDFSLRPSDI